MGNRGCLHDEAGNIIRTFARDAWICCLTKWPGIHRTLMAPGYYTELFFADEATALAAGHRPCGSCRAPALQAFKQAWARAHGLTGLPAVADIDSRLAEERGVLAPCPNADNLPDGAMVTAPNTAKAWLHRQGQWWLWSFAGYAPADGLPAGDVCLITPPAIVAILRTGYRPG
jgi:hypothetical protein